MINRFFNSQKSYFKNISQSISTTYGYWTYQHTSVCYIISSRQKIT
uniref:Uncharacterized protein n=1 Tax=Pseudodiaptomus poplesia TaxID=213370 RepID=A0A0U2USZ5_9MAXI|nr:hypothetical protein [Pseudodiaptomus poplesia]